VAQDSLSVQNGTGVVVRQAFNTAMQASATNQSGSSAPSTTYPFQFFADTNTNTLKIRNAANNAYINVSGVGQIGAANLGLLPAAGGTISGNLIVSGNLTVQGTTTTVSSTTITVTDKNIEIGKVSTPTDTTADGGGLTLLGATNKTWNWVDATDSWTSSENIDLASGKVLKANGTQILSATNFTGTSANATNVTVADESSDTSCNVLFTTAATGNLPPKTGTNLTFNSSSGALTATSFVGDLTGNVTGNVSGTSGSTTGNAATATALQTARDINGVSFDGTANITVADATKMPLAGGTFTGAVVHNYNTALTLPVGTTAQRPGSPSTGQIRFNSTTSAAEIYDGSAFTAVGGGGATGGGGEQIFHESENEMNNSYTITTNSNALVAGPLTIASGATLTINSPSVVTIP